jgi:hypothetical protein
MERHLIKEHIMYKKITHTIVEEHFAHPMAVNIAAGHKMGRHSLTEIMPTDQFKAFVDNYFIDLEGKLVEFANAAFDDSKDFQSALANAMDFEALGDTMAKYYDVEFKERFNQQIGNQIMQLMYYWRNTIRKFDNTDTLNRIKQVPVYFSQLLFTYNNFYDRDIVRSLFEDFFNEFLTLGAAKFAKNKVNETAALDRIAVAGSRLSNYLANGILQQQPELFTA